MPGSPLPRLQPSRVAPTGPSRSFNFCRAQPASALGRGPRPPGRPAGGGGGGEGGGPRWLGGGGGGGRRRGGGGEGGGLNGGVLALLGQGAAPQPAVASVLAANAEADAGLIAIDAQGVLGWGNSERVLRRSDLGQFQRDDGAARVAILHNSIFSCAPLAEQVGALAWAQLTGLAGPIGWVRLAAAVPRRIAHRDRVHIDPSDAITAIDSANPYVPTNLHRATVAYLGSEVWRHGVCVGRVMTELVADVADGMVMPFGDAAHDAFLMRTDHLPSSADRSADSPGAGRADPRNRHGWRGHQCRGQARQGQQGTDLSILRRLSRTDVCMDAKAGFLVQSP